MNDLLIQNGIKVCFFDSGIGGLTLLYECARKLSNAKLFYFADNFNVPYGSLDDKKLKEKVGAVFKEIASLEPTIAVIACNTVTARCAEWLRSKYSFPIVGIQPAVKQAVKDGKSCTVLATPATAGSQSLKTLIQNYGENRCKVVSCPNLARFIEDNVFDLDENKLFSFLPDIDTDTVVLGCTHYVFAQKLIQKRYKKPIFNGLEGTTNRILDILGEEEVQISFAESANITFCGGDEEKNRQVFYNAFFP